MQDKPHSPFGAAGVAADYASGQRMRAVSRQAPTWGLRTRQGDLTFSGLRTLMEAKRLKKIWDSQFPDYAPYQLTRDGAPYQGWK